MDTRAVLLTVYIVIAVFSSLSVLLCIYDKIAAKCLPGHRVPEAILLLLPALGGSFFMLLTMLLIRHKTKHAKFMIGIPVILLLQIAAAVFCFFYFDLTADDLLSVFS